jgi:HSP20 family protein
MYYACSMERGTAAGCGPQSYNPHYRGHYKAPFSSVFRAPVSIYKTEKTYELLLFAPGRVKENFHIQVEGNELSISYQPTDDTSDLDWVRKEYSRGGFKRVFKVDDTIDLENISAKYEAGVLQLSLPVKPGSELVKKEVSIQ